MSIRLGKPKTNKSSKRLEQHKIFRACGNSYEDSGAKVQELAEKWLTANMKKINLLKTHEHTTHDVKDDEFYYEHYIKFTYLEKEK